jgi:REP element-mobilizing transposase RayT
MSRPLRFLPEQGSLVEITCRTVHSRFLLRPGPELNEIVAGVLGRAQRIHEVGIIGFAFVSNHFHLLLRVRDVEQMADFMEYFNSNLARKVGRLAGWGDKFFSRRYQAIPISNEDSAQIERLRYVLSHGVKERLVDRVLDWPGIHAARPLLTGEPLEGWWFDRTKESAARRRGESFDRYKYATRETVVLEQLPCWAHLSPEEYRRRIAEMVAGIEAAAAAEREQTGLPVLGLKGIRAQRYHDRPGKPKKSPAPLFHAASRKVRQELYRAYGEFLGAFRDAAEKLRAGDRGALFPSGCFPPGLPFVPG